VLQCVALMSYHQWVRETIGAQCRVLSLQCVAACCSVLHSCHTINRVLQCVAQRVAAYCSVLQCVAVRCSVLQCVAVRENARDTSVALQCVAVCCSVLQCVAVCCSEIECARY